MKEGMQVNSAEASRKTKATSLIMVMPIHIRFAEALDKKTKSIMTYCADK